MGEMNPTGGNDEFPGTLSDSECEQLLAGQSVPGSDLGALFRLIEASDPTEPVPGKPMRGEAAALAAFRDFHAGSGVAHRRFTTRVATVALAGSVVLAGGVAAAATGHLNSIERALGASHRHSHSHSTLTPHVKPTPTAPASAPQATHTPPAGTKQQGKAHQGHGKGKGVGETAHPSHPAHPTHPSHPATPSHSSSPSHSPTQSPKSKHTPTPASSHSHKPRHTSSPNPNHTKSPNPSSSRTHKA
jgi:hypothetical protein